MMAWYSWFQPRARTKLPSAIAALVVLFAFSQMLGTPYSTPLLAPSISAFFQSVSTGLHLCFAAVMTRIVYQGTKRQGWDSLTVLTVALMAVALFASELSVLHVPGIWFPFGVGVSRAQFAYAGMDVALFAFLLRRHVTGGRAAAAA